VTELFKDSSIKSARERIIFELIKGGLTATRREMEALISRTSMSPFIREKKDFFTAILNPLGELVVSTSLTLAGNLLDSILETYPLEVMEDGDLYWFNDPYSSKGAVSHLPDMVFIMPAFSEGRLIAFVECWGHLWDIGGSVPGSISPSATSVFQEGIMIPPVRVIRAGVRNEEVFRIFSQNSRFPKLLEGDLNSLMAACQLGKKRVEELALRHTAVAIELAFEEIIVQTEMAFRSEILSRIPNGQWSFRDRIDSDAVSTQPYFIDLTMVNKDGDLSLDFTQTEKQANGPINFIMHDSVPKFMLGLFMTQNITGIGMNAGFQRAIKAVTTRKGSLLNPNSPAPLGLRSHSMFRVNSSLFGVLAQATGGFASAASSVYVLYYLRGKLPSGGEELCIEGLSVGYGARSFADGLDAVYYVAQENYPVEFAEIQFGVTIESFSIHEDSGGAGRYRGGCGIIRDIRVHLDEMVLGLRIDNCRYPAFGVSGGLSGSPGRVILNPETSASREIKTLSDGNIVKRGDLIRIITPGGGGWGCPYDRPPVQVFEDFLDGNISEQSVFTEYGVVLTNNKKEVDVDKTSSHRKTLKRPTKMFNRKIQYDAEDDRDDKYQV
jgi:N-methylhydantoinase B